MLESGGKMQWIGNLVLWTDVRGTAGMVYTKVWLSVGLKIYWVVRDLTANNILLEIHLLPWNL